MNALPREFIQNIVRAALAEDIGAGDITTEAAIPADQRAEACIVAKEPCVVAGLPLVEEVFAQIDRAIVGQAVGRRKATSWRRGHGCAFSMAPLAES